MTDDNISQDIQELRSRIETLEGADGGHIASVPRNRGRVSAIHTRSTIVPGAKPTLWKSDKGTIPPALAGLLPVSPGVIVADAASASWPCEPNPWVFTVGWNAGEVDEFYRLSNAVFTIFTFTTSKNEQYAAATYAATISPSGVGRSGAYQVFSTNLLNSEGGFIASLYPQTITIVCGEASHNFAWTMQFDAGLYSLIAGAHFNVSTGTPVARC